MIASYPGDPRLASALFTLGRVERARGKHAAAAEAFARCHKVAPHGSLAEDALAEEAVSWRSAGDGARAKAAAQRYMKLHPGGAHAARMMPLAE
jgi:transmembrane sensor